MRPLMMVALLGLVGCGGNGSNGVHCVQSLGQACGSNMPCPPTLAAAKQQFCMGAPNPDYHEVTCGGLTFISDVGVDTGTLYWYDASGHLAAIEFTSITGDAWSCGPTGFVEPASCASKPTPFCP